MKASEMITKLEHSKIEDEKERIAEQELKELGFQPVQCPECRGKGRMSVYVGLFWIYPKCPKCWGDGKIFEKKELN